MACTIQNGLKSCSREWKKGVLREQKNHNYSGSSGGGGGGWETLSLEDAIASLEEGLLPQPSIENLVHIIRKCTNERHKTDYALRLHAYIGQSGLEAHISLGNYLVSMLVEAECMFNAQKVFDRLVSRSERSWSSLINGYIKRGELRRALTLYQKMQEDSVHPSGHTFVALLKACAKLKDLERGGEIHAQISRTGLLESNLYVGTALVDMYAKCGMLAKAREVFDKLLVHDVALWNALVAGYAQHERGEEALKCLEQMQLDGLSPNAVTFACSLKACGSIGATEKGREIHAEIVRQGLLKTNQFVGNALVDMYAKCGSLAKAQEVFDMLPVQNVVSWNALIAGYIQHKHGEEALNCFERMQLKGVPPDAVTFACSLKACGSIGATDKGREIHADIERKGLLKNQLVGNALVDLYAKCSLLEKAQEVFDRLPVHDVVSWTALISGYVQHKRCDKALKCLEQMQLEGVSPDANTFILSLKACGSIGATDKGREIHAEIARKGLLTTNQFVGNALVDMYAKCGLLVKAHGVLDMLPVRNVVSWTALIVGYVQQERGKEALNCYEQMQLEGVSPDAVTLACILKACGSIGAIDKGREIHDDIERKGWLEGNPVVGTALVDMYAKCGMLLKAQEVFNKLPICDVSSWNALIAGYAQHEHGEEALNCFEQMQLQGVSPNDVTFACSLKACCSIGAIDKGREIHAEIVRQGLLKTNQLVGNALVDLYAKCGSLSKAQEVFDMLPVRNAVSWNALISGYAQRECGEEALKCFEQMQLEGVSPDDATFACSLKACGSIGAIDKGREIHADIEAKGLLESNLVVGTALVDMYAKFGMLAKAQEVFDKLPVRNVVSWTALIAGYAQHECGEEAMNCFEQMQLDGISPNANTFACSLKACGSSGAIEKGREIHADIEQRGFLKTNQIVGNALVDMYAKCGMLAKAQEVFDELPIHDVVSWNALITGCAQRGEIANVLCLFERMQGEGIKPNPVTFVSLLNACSHAGLTDKAQKYFEAMSDDYGITPTLEHHTCMVDLLGRAGQLDRAVALMKKTSSHPNIEMWLAVLGACRKWGNVELGRQAFEQAMQLDEKEAAAYVCMYNIYADAGMQEDAKKVEAMSEKQAGEEMAMLVVQENYHWRQSQRAWCRDSSWTRS